MTSLRETRLRGSRHAPEIDRYDPTEIEPRWQARWEELGMHTTDLDDDSRPKFYLLTMYDYPSGDLHIGHWFVKTPTDAISRFKRMHGYNVFFPVGFDAFGLPAENAAIKSGVQPREWTLRNIDNMRRQLRTMGATWDWSSEVVTCEPDYYRWNQWFFLQFLETGLAYRRWRRSTGAPRTRSCSRASRSMGADRVCWRCGTQVIKRDLEQWFFRTTKYADEYLSYREHRLPGADPCHADELDRPVGGRRDRLRRRLGRSDQSAARRSVSSPRGRTRCSAPRSWSWRRSTRWSRS